MDGQADEHAQARQYHKGLAPAQVLGRDAGDKAPGEAAEHGTGDIEAGDFGDGAAAPAIADIGHAGGEHQGNQQAFDQAPGQQLEQAASASQQHRRQCQEQGGQHDHRPLWKAAAQARAQRRAERHTQCGQGDAPAGLRGAHGKLLGQYLENALGGIQMEKSRATT